MPRRLEIVGAPSSAGAYTPARSGTTGLSSRGLPAFLEGRGIALTDRGDVPRLPLAN